MNYLKESLLILIPVLNVVGMIIKNIEKIPDKYIPILLLIFGIVGAVALAGFSAESVIQGIMITGTAVYGNQIYKQLKKND